ncbi:MAG: ATP-binding protein, partial [Burkholderiales bacterium]|nr:ATP-binding protein [Burkholderiales bacterium]
MAADRKLAAPDHAGDPITAGFDRLLERIDRIHPPPPPNPDFARAIAFRWRRHDSVGGMVPVQHPHHIALGALKGVETQVDLVDRNTRQFVAGVPANNVLLTGARGTGKSSLVKAVLHKYAAKGLRLIEVEKQDLIDLPDIVDRVADAPYRFILFSDDLSFEADEPGYKALKAVLDGSISATSDNVLIYATSNRRHLMPEFMNENLETKYMGDEIHPGETVEEKVSLSERFGLWVSFYPFDQDHYLAIARHWVEHLGVTITDATALEREALQWALSRGSRSGRVAWHFARD